MLYKARVISNNEFSQTGKIKVRIFRNTMPDLWKDLALIPDSIKQGNNIIKHDFGFKVKSSEDEAYVFSMYGGGQDFGFFALPQPNSIGIVSTIENDTNSDIIEYVWLGSVSFLNGSSINIPSNTEKDKNGVDKGSSSISNNGFVIKTKSTNYIDYNTVKSEDLDFLRKGYTNLISVTDRGIEFLYRNIINSKSDGIKVLGTSKILLNNRGISGEFYPYIDNAPDTEANSTFFIRNDGEVQLKRMKKNQASCTISTGAEIDAINNKEVGTIKLSVDGKEMSSNFRMQDNFVEAVVNGNTLKLSDKDGIFITAADGQSISLDAKLINLGTAGKSVVLVDNAIADATGGAGFNGDGVTFFASGTIKG